MQWTKEEIREVIWKINEKAQTDLDFRTLCLSNPNEAIKQISEKEIPAHFTVRFVENDGAHMTHVLPDYLGQTSELSEAELEQVAGGSDDKSSRCSGCGSTDLVHYKEGGIFCRNCLSGNISLE